MKALLVIDVDHYDGWHHDLISQSAERQAVAASIEEKLALMRERDTPVIFVTLVSSLLTEAPDSQLEPGERCLGCGDNEEIKKKLPEFLGHRHNPVFEPIFVKNKNDAFSNTELAPYLHSRGIKELLLVGCNTFACVMETAVGAVLAGFNVTLIEDATFPIFSDSGTKEKWVDSVKKRIPGRSKVGVAVSSVV